MSTKSRGKTRKSDVIVPNVRRHLAIYTVDEPAAPVILDRENQGGRTIQRVAPAEITKRMRSLLRRWEHNPVHTQEEFDQRARFRPDNFTSLPPLKQWEIDRKLGILDWLPVSEETTSDAG